MAGWKINRNTAETHNLILQVLSCHLLSGFASFWVSVFSFICLPSYIPTNTWFISQFNSINKKERNHVNDQLYFWKKPTVMYSQLAYRVFCSSEEAAPSGNLSCCLFTFHLHYETYLQNHPMATVYLQIQLHHQSWMPGYNHSRLLMWRCKSFPLMPKENFCWLLAEPRPCLLGGWPWIVQHIKIKDFSSLCDKFTWICQYCNIIFFFPQSLQTKNNTQTFPDCCAPAWMWHTELTWTMWV